jgi:hypothetical protein
MGQGGKLPPQFGLLHNLRQHESPPCLGGSWLIVVRSRRYGGRLYQINFATGLEAGNCHGSRAGTGRGDIGPAGYRARRLAPRHHPG